MIRIVYKELRSKKQLMALCSKRVVSFGEADDSVKVFEIVFDCGNEKRRDLLISFETRTPKLFISDVYIVPQGSEY